MFTYTSQLHKLQAQHVAAMKLMRFYRLELLKYSHNSRDINILNTRREIIKEFNELLLIAKTIRLAIL